MYIAIYAQNVCTNGCITITFMCMFICTILLYTHTGNTGSYLTDTGTVYITRDGGLIWEQVSDTTI